MSRLVNAVAFGSLMLAVWQVPPAVAEGWPSWASEAFGRSGNSTAPRRWSTPTLPLEQPPPDLPRNPPPKVGGDISDGGPRPVIAPKAPPVVAFPYTYPAKSIVIDTGGRKLYYVLENGQAYEYAISVGREGFNWTGTETVSRKQEWPSWHPPAEMRERDPSLPEMMTGGVKNPLGAVALYLGKTLYRIHGTNDVRSIGRAASSGCFRMHNASAVHLASITEIGTTVTVVPSLPSPQQVSQSMAPAQPANLPSGVQPGAPKPAAKPN